MIRQGHRVSKYCFLNATPSWAVKLLGVRITGNDLNQVNTIVTINFELAQAFTIVINEALQESGPGSVAISEAENMCKTSAAH